MFSACTSIKVAVSLNKIADLPKEHSLLSAPFSQASVLLGRDLFSLLAGPGRIDSEPWQGK